MHIDSTLHDFTTDVDLEAGDHQTCPLTDGQHLLAGTLGLEVTAMVPTPILLDTGATINLIHYDFLPEEWKSKMRQYKGKTVRTANDGGIHILGVIKLRVQLGDLKVNVWFGVSRNLIQRVILGTPFYYRFIKGIFPQERKVVPIDSKPVPILANPAVHNETALPHKISEVHMADAAETLRRLQVHKNCNVRVAKARWLEPWEESTVLCTSKTSGLCIVNPKTELLDKKSIQAAVGIHDIIPNRPFYMLVSNFSSYCVWLQKNTTIAFADDVPHTIIEPKADEPQLTYRRDAPDIISGPEDGPTLRRGGDPAVLISNSENRSTIRAKTVDWSAQGLKDNKTDKDPDEWMNDVHVEKEYIHHKPRLVRLLQPLKSMWSGELGCIKATQHRINLLPGSKPIHQQPYRAGPAQRQAEQKEIQSMLDKGVIEPANTEWTSPIVFVPKPDGTLRFCVDYRRLNAMTIRDSYPIPRMDEFIDSLGDAVIFTTLDCNSGYWQIEMADEDKDKTAFISHSGLYRWLRMPFGLKNAPGTF